MAGRFSGRVIWITGASSGIGEALAKALAREGARLILSGRREAALAHVATECAPAETLVLPFDATDMAALPKSVEQALEWRGHIDMLINNAGVSQRSLAVDTSMTVYRRLMEVDFFAPVALTKLVLPAMLERRAGHIVVMSSVAGKVGPGGRTGYAAAKHALQGFFDALRAEVSHDGLYVSLITPGFIRTEIGKNALKGDGRPTGVTDKYIAGGMNVERAAQVMLRGLAAKREEIAVGQGIEMHALWLKRLSPRLISYLTRRMAARDYR